jgi:hypothetical protein
MRKADRFVLLTAHRSPLIAGPGDFAGTLAAVAPEARTWFALTMHPRRAVMLAAALAGAVLVPTLASPPGVVAAAGPPSPPARDAAGGTRPPGSAPAPPPAVSSAAAPQQILWLRSGAVLRGSVVEYVPGHHATLELATGEVRSVPWDELASVSWATQAAHASARAPDNAAAPDAPAASASRPPQPAGAPARPRVRVTVQADSTDLWLETRERASTLAWRRVCSAPCDLDLNVEDKLLRVRGEHVPASSPFRIEGERGSARLHVRAGSGPSRTLGQVALVGGIVLGLGSASLYGAGRLEDDERMVVGGIVGLAAAGVAVVAALPLLARGSTTVRNASGERIGRAAPPPAPSVWPAF